MTWNRPALTLAACAAMAALPPALNAQTFKVNKFDIGGAGAFDYVAVDPSSGHVFVSRSNHMMAVDGMTGKVLADILDTPGVHGAAFSTKDNHGFTTNGGDSTVTMFDLKTFAVIKKIATHTGGLDGIMYDDATDRIFTINHGRPGSTLAIDAKTGTVVGTLTLDGNAPEGGTSDGHGRIYINVEDKNEIQVVDAKALTSVTTWPLAPCDGPGGIAIDRQSMRIFSACGGSSIDVVVDVRSGKVVAQFPIGPGPDALGFDPSQKLIYTPGGGGRGAAGAAPVPGSVTITHEDGPDKYSVVSTVTTMNGARTLAVDAERHRAYTFTPEYGPAPTPAPGTPPPTGRGRGPRGPILAAWLFAISH